MRYQFIYKLYIYINKYQSYLILYANSINIPGKISKITEKGNNSIPKNIKQTFSSSSISL